MLIEIKELCNQDYGKDGYIDQDDSVYVSTGSITFVRYTHEYVSRIVPNPDYNPVRDEDDDYIDTHISERNIEVVYFVHTAGSSESDIIVIDEAAMSVLKGAL